MNSALRMLGGRHYVHGNQILLPRPRTVTFTPSCCGLSFQELRRGHSCGQRVSASETAMCGSNFQTRHRRFSLEKDMAAVCGDCSFEHQTPATFTHDSSGTLGVCRSLSPSLLYQSTQPLFNSLRFGRISRIYFRGSIFDHTAGAFRIAITIPPLFYSDHEFTLHHSKRCKTTSHHLEHSTLLVVCARRHEDHSHPSQNPNF